MAGIEFSQDEITEFTEEVKELIFELNERIRHYNDLVRDVETPGANVIVGPNGFYEASQYGTTSISADITLAADDFALTEVFEVDTSSAAVTITLPAASTVKGMGKSFVNIGTGTMTLDGSGSETIIGATTLVSAVQWDAPRAYCNGTSWVLV